MVAAAGNGGVGDGAEIDVGRNVLQADQTERVGVRMVTIMAHQGAGAALRVVILALRKTIIEEDGGAAPQ